MSELPYPTAFGLGTSYALCFTPDETALVVVASRLQLWDVVTGKRLHSVPWGNGSDADVSPDGALVVASNTSGDLIVLDARTFEQRYVARGRDIGEGAAPFFAPGGQIVQCSWGGHVVVRQASTGEIVWRDHEEGHMITQLACTPDRTLFAYAGSTESGGFVRLRRWPFDRHEAEELTRVGGSVAGLAFDAEGRRLAVQSSAGLAIWDIENRSRSAELPSDEYRLEGIAWAPDGELVAVEGAAEFAGYSAALGPLWRTPLSYACAVACSPSGALLALGSWERGVVLRRMRTDGASPEPDVVPEEEPVSVQPRDAAEEQVIGYVEIEAGEGVAGLEKVASERIGSARYDVWDVETESGRWWAIAGDALGAYDQAEYTSSDVALSFHVGISARLRSEDRGGSEAWRHFERAVDAFADADMADDARLVGAALVDALAAFEPSGDGPLAAYVASTAVELARAAAWLAAAEDARPDECRIVLDGVRQLLESAARLR